MKNIIGSNQYRAKRKLSHKVRVHLSVYVLLIIATFSAIVCGKIRSHELDLMLHTQTIYAMTPERPYVEPQLNPNESGRDQVIGLIKKVWGKDAQLGLAIARCESGYSPTKPHVSNTDGSVDQGVFSINSVHQMPDMENMVANISYAYSMYLTQGTTPWNPSKGCWE